MQIKLFSGIACVVDGTCYLNGILVTDPDMIDHIMAEGKHQLDIEALYDRPDLIATDSDDKSQWLNNRYKALN